MIYWHVSHSRAVLEDDYANGLVCSGTLMCTCYGSTIARYSGFVLDLAFSSVLFLLDFLPILDACHFSPFPTPHCKDIVHVGG